MADPWTWRAVLADGTALDEIDADAPEGRGWAQAVRLAEQRGTVVAAVMLVPQRAHLTTHVLRCSASASDGDGGAMPRVFRRRTLTLDIGGGAEVGTPADPITVLALEWPDGRAAYTFLFADGSVAASDDLNAV